MTKLDTSPSISYSLAKAQSCQTFNSQALDRVINKVGCIKAQLVKGGSVVIPQETKSPGPIIQGWISSNPQSKFNLLF
jgi:hypothetical protein